jgi:hypothetical protein
MIRYKLISLILLLLICFFSCPQDLVKGTVWTGIARGDSGEANLTAFFRSDNTLIMYVQKMYTYSTTSTYYEATGSYAISGVNSMRANLSAKVLFDSDNNPDLLTLDLDGTLYTATGRADGSFVLKVDNANSPDFSYTGKYELNKQNSY